MAHSNIPPPPPRRASFGEGASVDSSSGEPHAKMPWRKPTLYLLTDLMDTTGAPTGKVPSPNGFEDESTTIGMRKQYRPTTAPTS